MKLIDDMMHQWGADDWFVAAMLALAMAALVGAFWVGVRAVQSDGRVDFCYMTRNPGALSAEAYVVRGHVPWRPDYTLGNADSPEAALQLMRKVCPVPVATVESE